MAVAALPIFASSFYFGTLKGSTAGLSQDFSMKDPFRMANMPEADESQTDYVALMEKVPTTAGNRLH
jgi:hypothetical protein